MGYTTTKSYLAEFKGLSKLSRRDYAEALKDMMSKISESIAGLAPLTPEGEELDVEMPELGVVETSVQLPTVNLPALSDVDKSPPVAQSSGNQNIPVITAHDLSPPEVQRVLVEHIVKREDTADAVLTETPCILRDLLMNQTTIPGDPVLN